MVSHIFDKIAIIPNWNSLNFVASIWSIVYFVPMNKYFDAGEYEAETLKQMVKRWTMEITSVSFC